jgi:hypothetical protein
MANVFKGARKVRHVTYSEVKTAMLCNLEPAPETAVIGSHSSFHPNNPVYGLPYVLADILDYLMMSHG